MSNLRLLKPADAAYAAGVVATLEDLLARAKEGKISEFFAVVHWNGTREFRVVNTAPMNTLEAIGRLESIKLQMWDNATVEPK